MWMRISGYLHISVLNLDQCIANWWCENGLISVSAYVLCSIVSFFFCCLIDFYLLSFTTFGNVFRLCSFAMIKLIEYLYRRANFTSADMRESDFSGSTFNGAYLEKAVAYKANFAGKVVSFEYLIVQVETKIWTNWKIV